MNYSNIKIFRNVNRKQPDAIVIDGDKLINSGNRPVDFNFADRVYNTVVGTGYEASQDDCGWFQFKLASTLA